MTQDFKIKMLAGPGLWGLDELAQHLVYSLDCVALGRTFLLVYRGTSHGPGAGVKQNCATCFLAYSSQQQQGNCMDPSGFCAA